MNLWDPKPHRMSSSSSWGRLFWVPRTKDRRLWGSQSRKSPQFFAPSAVTSTRCLFNSDPKEGPAPSGIFWTTPLLVALLGACLNCLAYSFHRAVTHCRLVTICLSFPPSARRTHFFAISKFGMSLCLTLASDVSGGPMHHIEVGAFKRCYATFPAS